MKISTLLLDDSMQGIAQNTPTWMEWKNGKIGSSAASAIAGESKWCTPLLLWERMLGLAPEQEQNWQMSRGLQLEPQARACYELEHDAEMPPALAEHTKYPFLIASLDGLNRKLKTILEIKCPGKEDHATAVSGEIPRHYKPQLIHQLMVADMDRVHYFSFKDGNGVLVEFHRDLKLEKELLNKELAFWECVQEKVPPEPNERDFHKIKDEASKFLFTMFKEKKEKLDLLDLEVNELKKQIVQLADGKRVLCEGVQVMPVSRKGAVNYSSIPQLSGVDLEQFRKAATSYVDVRVKK